MSDSFIQLPTDGLGKELRLIYGDGTTTLIPSGVYEEMVIPTDAQGVIPGDTRQRTLAVRDPTLDDVLEELRAMRLILQAAFDL